MPSILCFGDSNTYGYIPGTDGDRFSREKRWTGILQEKLGQNYHVIEEGLSGRTTAFDDPDWEGRNGIKFLPFILETHSPIDLMIIMLGVNDIKERFNLTAKSISEGLRKLLDICITFNPKIKDILVISPANIRMTKEHEYYETFKSATEKSKFLAKYYQEVCLGLNSENQVVGDTKVHFLDANDFITTSELDGVHLNEEMHNKLANILSKWISKNIF